MLKTKFLKSYILVAFSYTLFLFAYSSSYANSMNGFNLDQLTIERSEILSGGPGRDGIPSINQPKFIAPELVDFLRPEDMVMSFSHGNETKAYPLRILIWHEIVNDSINGLPIAVTYCPLCGTGMVFDRNIKGQQRSFGVSGLLYRSDVLMYDRETESLWSQLGLKGVSNQSIDIKLKWLPNQQMTWQAWQQLYPNGKVLSTDTGYRRQYSKQAYASYFASDSTMFPVPKLRTELKQKSKILGVIINGVAKAYPIEALAKVAKHKDTIVNQTLTIHYDKDNKSALVNDSKGELIPFVEAYWFAWQGFYPKTLLGLH